MKTSVEASILTYNLLEKDHSSVGRIDTSAASDSFWDTMYYFANSLFFTEEIDKVFTREELTSIAYTLFDDFSGDLPQYQISFYEKGHLWFAKDDNLIINPASGENHETELKDYTVDSDRNITAYYSVNWTPYLMENPTIHYFCIKMRPNSHFNTEDLFSKAYTILSVEKLYLADYLTVLQQLDSNSNYYELAPLFGKGIEEVQQEFQNLIKITNGSTYYEQKGVRFTFDENEKVDSISLYYDSLPYGFHRHFRLCGVFVGMKYIDMKTMLEQTGAQSVGMARSGRTYYQIGNLFLNANYDENTQEVFYVGLDPSSGSPS